jgi:hypothetical protein
MRTPASKNFALVELLRGRAGPVVRVRGDEEADANASAGSLLDPSDHPAVGDVRVDDIQRLGRPFEQARDCLGDRPVPAGSVVKYDRGNGVRAALQRGEEGVQLGGRDPTAEPAKTGKKDELELGNHRAGDPHEQVVKAAVLEVVLDSGAADPADAPVDDHELAVVDVS